jgi:integrase
MLMTFLRAGALVRLEWDWIDENEGIIVIPGNTPGLKRTFKTQHLPHHIPITHEMKQMLDAARKLDFSEKYVFGSYRQGKSHTSTQKRQISSCQILDTRMF